MSRSVGGKLLSVALLAAAPAASAEQAVTFEGQVKPILERHCVDCHSGWFPDAGVDLSSLQDIMKGGPSGPLIAPGQPDKGWLMYTINQRTGRMRMPPDGPGLSEQEKDTLKAWIEAGAR